MTQHLRELRTFFQKIETLCVQFSELSLDKIFPSKLKDEFKKRDKTLFYLKNSFECLQYTEDEYPPQTISLHSDLVCNPFLRETMKVIGGGEGKMLAKMSNMTRRGGSLDDALLVVKLHDKEFKKDYEFLNSVSTISGKIGISFGCVKWGGLEEGAWLSTQNLDANPGPTYIAMGFKKKRESLALAWDISNHIVDCCTVMWKHMIKGKYVPRYSLAGRTKLNTFDKHDEKEKLGKPIGRAVWIGDQHEALLAASFVQPLCQYLYINLHTICNGFNKFDKDPAIVLEKLEKWNKWIVGDFSFYDGTIPAFLIRRAFKIIRYAFGITCKCSKEYILLDWLEDQVINTKLVLPTGRAVTVPNGIPSGSGFTALLDSLINCIIWHEYFSEHQFECGLIVQGDDNVVGFNNYNEDEFILSASTFFKNNFGMVLSVDDTLKCKYSCIGLAQPKVPKAIRDGSSREVYNYRKSLENKLGRKLTFFEKFEVLTEEPSYGEVVGNTHRWTYLFHDRITFLSHYFKRDFNTGQIVMVRPTAEVVERLMFPETRVKNLNDHIDRLQTTLIENWGNLHVKNHIMHYMYDAFLLKKAGIVKYKYLKRNRNNPILQRRGWYRKVDRVVDLEIEDEEFRDFWNDILKRSAAVYDSIFANGYMDWSTIRNFRRGKLRVGYGHQTFRRFSEGDLSQNNIKKDMDSLGLLGYGLWAREQLRNETFALAKGVLNQKCFRVNTPQFAVMNGFITNLREYYRS